MEFAFAVARVLIADGHELDDGRLELKHVSSVALTGVWVPGHIPRVRGVLEQFTEHVDADGEGVDEERPVLDVQDEVAHPRCEGLGVGATGVKIHF